MTTNEQCPGCVRLVSVAKDQENSEQRLSGILDDFRELKITIQECITGVQSGVKMLTEGAHRFERNEEDFKRHTSGEDGAHSRLKTDLAALTKQIADDRTAWQWHRKWLWAVAGSGLVAIMVSEHGKQFLAFVGLVPK